MTELKRLLSSSTSERMEANSALSRLMFMGKNYLDANENFGEEAFMRFSIDKIVKSKSQLFQDLFVLYYLKEKRNGFFVEFGATNGIDLSNSYLLEKEYDWKGIVAEPAKIWHFSLRNNRGCSIETKCVWSVSDLQLTFNEFESASLSQVSVYEGEDFNSSARVNKQSYSVNTISLSDLLAVHNAPYEIDYLSVDTEGSEFEILNGFNFERYSIKIITVEHNFTENREKIFDLLTSKGYNRVFEKISLFDDWYVKQNN